MTKWKTYLFEYRRLPSSWDGEPAPPLKPATLVAEAPNPFGSPKGDLDVPPSIGEASAVDAPDRG